MGKMSRNKGASFEREIAKVMRAVWPDARRGGGDQAGPMGRPDVDGTPYWIECKRYANVTRAIVKGAHQQAQDAAIRARDSRPVLVVTRSDRRPAVAHFEVLWTVSSESLVSALLVSVPLSEWIDHAGGKA